MNELKCSDISGTSCSFVAKAYTKRGTRHNLMKHAMDSHHDMVSNISPDEKKKMESKLNMMMS
jgi:predicted small metal-binding protein